MSPVRSPARRLVNLVALVARFVLDLLVSSGVVAWEILTPRHRSQPAIVTVPVRCRKDIEITILANLVSLTPGTLTIDVDQEAGTIDVHALHVRSPEELRTQVRRIEDRLLGVIG